MADDVRAPSDTAALRLAERTGQHTGCVPDRGHVLEIARKNVEASLPKPRRRLVFDASCPACGLVGPWLQVGSVMTSQCACEPAP